MPVIPLGDPEMCANCDRKIGRLETPRLWEGKVVCAECDRRLRDQNATTKVAAVPVTQIHQHNQAAYVPAAANQTISMGGTPSSTDFDGTRVVLSLAVVAGIVVIVLLILEWVSRAEVIQHAGGYH